ncbi:alpha-(1-_3)-arabinofuranosyltransferase domain-containing protein, partial [Angustibacter peucedani]
MTAEPQAVAGAVARWTARLWVHLASLFLVVLVLVQSPRTLSADTKLDLSVDPVGFLGRALSLWDPQAAAGQLQNQAYGYLFPMGPFFAGLHALGVPPWVVQRLWWCLVLLAAFHGARLLLGRLQVGTPTTQLVAALAYALSPRLLGVLGAVSSEIWPMAVAPWVLLPLVRVPPGAERRRAAWSAVAVACAGGINAVATAAVLPLPALWLLRGVRERTGRRLAGWWVLCVGLATLWWAVPLLLLGRYSPPFLDWIESAAVTTSTASLPEALRGTTHWIAGLQSSAGPLWPAAFQVLSTRLAVVAGLLVALAGLAGLASRSLPHRRLWRAGLVVGLVLLTLGHTGGATAPWADGVQHLLDGSLSPLRNVHKFDLVVRLPLAVGLAHALAQVGRLRVRQPLLPGLVRVVAVSCLVVLTAPAALVGVAQRGAFTDVPDWWRETARYLAAEPTGGRTLVLPGASFAGSYWGDPRDEPLQPLASSPWIVRDGVPLGSGGATRLLTRLEQVVQTGQGGEELADLLAELDVTRVVQRSDLDWRAAGAPPPLVVRQALRTTPGVRTDRTFGPLVGGSTRSDVALADGLDQPVPTIQVWTTGQPDRTVQLTSAADVAVRSGGTEQPSGTGVLAADARSVAALRAAGGGGRGIVTDTLQRREANFAAVRDAWSTVLPASTPYPADRAGHDWFPTRLEQVRPADQTTLDVQGGAHVTASSSRADPLLGGVRDLSAAPTAALDGTGDTAWVSARAAVGESWSVRFDRPVDLPAQLDVVLDQVVGADVSRVEVVTDRGRATTGVTPPPTPTTGSPTAPEAVGRHRVATLAVPAGTTSRLELRVTGVRGDQFKPVVLVEVAPGLLPVVVRRLVVPAASGRTDEVRLGATPDRRDACSQDDGGIARCQPSRGRQGEESLRLDRSVAVEDDGTFTLTGTVRARWGAAVDRLLDSGRTGPVVTASSTWVPDATLRPSTAVDGDPRSYWAPAPDDPRPTLTLQYPRAVHVTGLALDTDPEITGSRPTKVEVTLGERTVERDVDIDGTVAVPSTTTRRVVVRVTGTTRTTGISGLLSRPLPVVVGELRVGGAPAPLAASPDALTGVPCGFGPTVLVDGQPVATAVEGTVAEIESGAAVRLRACRRVPMTAGRHDVTLTASAEFGDADLRLERRGVASPADPTTPAVLRWQDDRRSVQVPADDGARVLVVAENANDGWTAQLGGRTLPALVVDGWEQAFVVPAGAAGTVQLTFAPQTPYRLGLLVGALTLLLVVVLALVPSRGGPVPPVSLPRRGLLGRPRPVLERVAVVVAGLALAGWPGLVAAVAVAAASAFV